MKIGDTPSPQRAVNTQQQQNKTVEAVQAKATSAQSADDIIQDGLQTAQLTLSNDVQSDVDYDKVAQMQAALAAGTLTVDTDELASSMLSFYQK